MTVFNGGAGQNNNFVGGASADTFNFAVADFNNLDTVVGGSGSAVDLLQFTTAGTILSSAFANVSGIEQINLFNGGSNSIALTDALVGSANGTLLTVTGGAGNDTINGAAVTTASNRLTIIAGAGVDSIVGGAGVDVVRFNVADLTSADTVAGGGGASSDTLQFLTAGTFSAGALNNVSGFEYIRLADGANSLTLTDAIVGSANGASLGVIGGAGNDTINGNAVVTATNRLDITAGAGVDSIVGGAGNDQVRFNAADLTSADRVTGGAGLDTLLVTSAGTISAANMSGVLSIEKFIVSVGGVNVSFDDAFMNANTTNLVVTGGSGNETIDGSAITTRALTIVSGAGSDSLVGGSGYDVFRFNSGELGASDTIVGGGGAAVDQLVLQNAATVVAADFGHVTGIERVVLANGANSVALSDGLVGSATGGLVNVVGGTGNDTVIGSAVTTATNKLYVTSGSGNDSLVGGAGADTFRFNAIADLTSADSIVGGGGAVNDSLAFGESGVITASALSHVSGIEQILLGVGTANNVVTLTDAVVGSANGAQFYISGTNGSDSVDGSAVTTSANRITFAAYSGNDALVGGAGADTFRVNAGDLNASDRFVGGAGASIDQLQLMSAGTVGAAAFTNVSGIESIALANGTNSITLTDALVGSANNTLLAVIGGTGNDSVNASAVTTAANRIDVTAGSGNDSVIGGAGADQIRFTSADLTASDSFNGGAGSDSVLITTAGTVTAASLAGISNVEQINIFGGGISLTLSDAVLNQNAATLIVTGGAGNDTVNASSLASNHAINALAGAGVDSLVGGAGADQFRINIADLTNADTIAGGAGASVDQLTFLTAGTISAANLSGVSGVERINLAAGANNIALSDALVSTANGTTLQVVGGTGNDLINGGSVTSIADKLDLTAGSGNDTMIGGLGADIIRFAVGELTGLDSVNGGIGTQADTLAFTNAGIIDTGAFSNVTQIEKIQLANGTNTVTLTDAFVDAATGDTVTVAGGTGADNIDISQVGNRTVVVNSGDGADAVTLSYYGTGNFSGDLGAGNDTLYANYNQQGTVAGGSGTDVVVFDTYYYSSMTMSASLTGFEVVNLTDSYGGSANPSFTANDTAGLIVNATDPDDNVTIQLGANGQTANGGAGNDTLHGGSGVDVLNGGGGNDYIDYSPTDATLNGGSGTGDILHTSVGGTFDLSNAADQASGAVVAVNFESVFIDGNVGASVTGTTGANTLYGGDGDVGQGDTTPLSSVPLRPSISRRATRRSATASLSTASRTSTARPSLRRSASPAERFSFNLFPIGPRDAEKIRATS